MFRSGLRCQEVRWECPPSDTPDGSADAVVPYQEQLEVQASKGARRKRQPSGAAPGLQAVFRSADSSSESVLEYGAANNHKTTP
jgi:hypothetical protein